MLICRDARESDSAVLGAIDYACWSPSTDPGTLWSPDRPFFGEPTQTRVEDVIVAAVDETAAGFIKIRPQLSAYGDWLVAGLGVAPSMRRRGIGRLLVHAALARAIGASATGVWLKVLSSNSPALQLYRSCGFVEVERHRGQFFRGSRMVDDLRIAAILN